jgi:glycosyltransferase involved in cell wall biosynthesis
MTGAVLPERVLHVAALPFPSTQGTQAAIASMLRASMDAGRDAHLLTYGGSDEHVPGVKLHRAQAALRPSMRSGPSLQKLRLDAGMLLQLRRLQMELSPEVLVAHHVEAALQALALRRRAWVFFAHTDLDAELPMYGPHAAQRWLAFTGRVFDRTLLHRAPAIATISPALRDRFAQTNAELLDKMAYVPTPWPVHAPSTTDERARSRSQLGLGEHDTVLLYAGNLDAYQGIDLLLHTVARLVRTVPTLTLLIATASPAGDLLGAAGRFGLGPRLRLTELQGDAARRRAHAAADLVVVPRLAPGGLPIKLLDALSRGVPCVAAPRACAGLPLAEAACIARSDDAEALAHAVFTALTSSALREQLSLAGPRYVAREHATERYLEALDPLLVRAVTRR